MNSFRLCLSLLGLMLCLGCGGQAPEAPETYPVSGTVTLNGQPLESGDILFEAEEGSGDKTYAGKIDGGSFSFESTPGTKKVRISSMQETGETREDNPGEVTQVMEEAIPENYNTNTELTAEVKAEPQNTFTFELTK